MKKLLIPGLCCFLIFAGTVSCKKIVSTVFNGTDVAIAPIEITIPPIFSAGNADFTFGNVTQSMNLDSLVRANTKGIFGANVVSSIKLKHVTLQITNADALNNLANFRTAGVGLQSNTENTPVNLFTVTLPDTYAGDYSFSPSGSPELLPYLKGNTLSFEVFGNARRTTSKSLNLRILITLRVN